MKNLNLNMNNVLIAIGAIVVAGFAYWFFFTDTGNETPITATLAGSESQGRFESLVRQLGPISFKTDVLSDPRFRALVNLATPVATELSGRVDPFAPISGVSSQ